MAALSLRCVRSRVGFECLSVHDASLRTTRHRHHRRQRGRQIRRRAARRDRHRHAGGHQRVPDDGDQQQRAVHLSRASESGATAWRPRFRGSGAASARDVTVSVQDRRGVDFVLEVGAIARGGRRVGRAELLQTQSADIGAVVDERQVRDLPLLGRRYAELALLAPGVVVAPAGITSRGEDTFFNANGNYATWNNYTLDGADNNSMSTNLQERSPQVVAPPVDALQEFKVQTRTYSAEFGKAAGAVINASVKQGTNQFRGTLFEFFRDEAMNANTWDNNRAGVEKGPVQSAHRRRRARRPAGARPDVLLRRLPGDADRARVVADGDRADRADAAGRSQRAHRAR